MVTRVLRRRRFMSYGKYQMRMEDANAQEDANTPKLVRRIDTNFVVIHQIPNDTNVWGWSVEQRAFFLYV